MNWLTCAIGVFAILTLLNLFDKPDIKKAPYGLEAEWFANQTAHHRDLTVCFVVLVAAYIVSLFVR